MTPQFITKITFLHNCRKVSQVHDHNFKIQLNFTAKWKVFPFSGASVEFVDLDLFIFLTLYLNTLISTHLLIGSELL